MKRKKKFRIVDAVLSIVCITLVVESIMPTAAIGNTQYFWWILLLGAFCLPYGMITAELSTTFPSEGGLYSWVKRAFGLKWAGRVAWNYWINFPLWIASLAVAMTAIIAGMFHVELSFWVLLLLELAYIWLVTVLGTHRVGESKYIVNVGTVFKVLLTLGLGAIGLYAVIKTGESANPIRTAFDLFPTLDLASLSFISIIIFNFLGFEVIGTYVDDMENPNRDIPKALIIGGLLMAIFYVLPATGFVIALPMEEIAKVDPENFVETLMVLLTQIGLSESLVSLIIIIAGLLLVYTFIANIASWSFGVNSVAKFAADDGSLPKPFSKTNKEGVPYMAAIINGIVASLIAIGGLIAYSISDNAGSMFELFFCLSWITLLIGYVPLFLAFRKLRKTDDTPRVYRVPGDSIMIGVLTYVPFILLVAGIVFTLFGDFTAAYLKDNIPLIVGVILSFAVEEILVAKMAKQRKDRVKENIAKLEKGASEKEKKIIEEIKGDLI